MSIQGNPALQQKACVIRQAHRANKHQHRRAGRAQQPREALPYTERPGEFIWYRVGERKHLLNTPASNSWDPLIWVIQSHKHAYFETIMNCPSAVDQRNQKDIKVKTTLRLEISWINLEAQKPTARLKTSSFYSQFSEPAAQSPNMYYLLPTQENPKTKNSDITGISWKFSGSCASWIAQTSKLLDEFHTRDAPLALSFTGWLNEREALRRWCPKTRLRQ